MTPDWLIVARFINFLLRAWSFCESDASQTSNIKFMEAIEISQFITKRTTNSQEFEPTDIE